MLRRSSEMKACIKPVFQDKNRKNNSLHFVHGSFSTTAGRQYPCITAFAIMYSVNLWDSKDLDDILLQGDQIYKDLKRNVFLNPDEIPRQINLFGVSIELDFTQNKFGMLFGNQKDHLYFINCKTVGEMSCKGLIFFIAGIYIAIIPNCVYLFDSYSRDSFGMSKAIGFSTCIKLICFLV